MRVAATVVIALVLAGCNRANPSICSTVQAVRVNAYDARFKKPLGAEEDLDDCVHRWSYRLAQSGEKIDAIADGVAAGCSNLVDRVITEKDRWLADNHFELTMTSPTTGLDVPVEVGVRQQAHSMALFYALQARAGHCAVPK